jgi:zinc protease
MANKFCTALAALLIALAAAPASALLPIQQWTTKGGARVYFVESHELPMLDVSVDFAAGSAFDTPEKSGLAGITLGQLRLGAGGLSENEISRRMADTGAQLGNRFDSDRGGMSLRTLTSKAELQQALDVFARLLQSPEFPAAVLEREKARAVGAIRESDTKPETLLSRTFSKMIYGMHPYGLRGSGEATTVAALTRDDVAGFYRRYYVANRSVVAMMGDVTREQAAAIAEQLTAGLPQSDVANVIPPVPSLEHAEMRAVAHPASQSHLMMGMPGIRRDDPDYFPLYVGNYILGGGGFVSRMLEEVRSKRGLAYSAYSYFLPLKERGPFVIGLQTRRDQVGEALAVVRSTLAEFLAKGPTDDELAKAKQNLVGGFALRIDSNRKIVENLAAIGFYDLPLTYLDDFTANVEKVTVDDIRRAFARHVDPARMATVVVGADEQSLAAAAN